MKKIIIALFLFFSALNLLGQENPISYIKLEITHPIEKTPYNRITIELLKRPNRAHDDKEVVLSVNTKPSSLYEIRGYKKLNGITVQDFDMLLQKINALDITPYFNIFDQGGYSTTITYGTMSNNISYKLSGLQEGKEYPISSFCKNILRLIKLNPDEIL
ncbi:hypothetical protein [Flammeovirga aprica]|uniref:Uncharacterized protein n=1 Tax=Flammeovirga aprica JL-4 TaxID=694437 RepID=A0A7X9RZR2_9BACT|nr:hypothetical protein [Flammeovirga aprica]NME71674.1 hypothetical protein [Flammeovirga aprica JL-4]